MRLDYIECPFYTATLVASPHCWYNKTMNGNLKKLALSLLFLALFVPPASGAELIASRTSYRYHYPQCKLVKEIKPSNILRFKSLEEAKRAGYVPCRRCNPPKAATAALIPKQASTKDKATKAEELCSKGNVLALEKKCREALPYFDRAIKEDPTRVDAYFQSGVCKTELGQHKGAIEAFNRVIAMDSGNGGAYYSLGVLYAYAKHYDRAIDAYRQAIKLKPDDGPAYYNLGVVYATLERYEDAAGTFKEAVRVQPDLPLAHNNLGVAYSNLKRYEEAADAFREALRLKSDDAFARYNLGVISIGLGRYAEAIECLNRISQMKPDDEPTRYHLGVAYLKAGDRKSSMGQYQVLLGRGSPLAARLYGEIGKE